MLNLLKLLAAIALLVWGTHMVRTVVLRVIGGKLRDILARGDNQRFVALLAGLGVTGLLQSSTATCLIVSAFVGQGMTPPRRRWRLPAQPARPCTRPTSSRACCAGSCT